MLAISRRRRVVALHYAARIVCLLADQHDARYGVAARRFLVRVIEGLEPPMEQVKRLAVCLVSVHNSPASMMLSRVAQDASNRQRLASTPGVPRPRRLMGNSTATRFR